MSRPTLPLIAFLAGLSACGTPEALLRPVAEDAVFAKQPSGPTDPTATFIFTDSTVDVRNDGQEVYANGVCGVTAKIFATTAASNSGDATMQTNTPRAKDRLCQVRTLTIDYGDGEPQTSTVFVNLHQMSNTSTYMIPIGRTETRALTIDEARCGGLLWRATLNDGTVTNANFVNVTRVDAITWLVQSQPDPNNMAYCRSSGLKHKIAVRFTVVSSDTLP